MTKNTQPTQSDSLRQQLIADLEKYKSFGTPFTEDMADHIISMFVALYAPKSDESVDAILSEYFTWRGEAIHEVNQTQNYQRMKAKLEAHYSERERRAELMGRMDEHKQLTAATASALNQNGDKRRQASRAIVAASFMLNVNDFQKTRLATLQQELATLQNPGDRL